MSTFTHTIAWLRAVIGSKVHDERGFFVSSENLMWIIGILAIVGLVVAFLNNYIQGLLAQI